MTLNDRLPVFAQEKVRNSASACSFDPHIPLIPLRKSWQVEGGLVGGHLSNLSAVYSLPSQLMRPSLSPPVQVPEPHVWYAP